MKLELKKIKLGPGSEETTQFTADLYVNDKLAAHCDNSGKGGSTDIMGYEIAQRKLIEQAEVYCKTLPDHKVSDTFVIEMDLEHWVDQEVEKFANEKHLVKEKQRILATLKRDCEKKIVIVKRKEYDDFVSGVSTKFGYSTINLKKSLSMFNPIQLKEYVETKVKPSLEPGQFIYNSNLPA